MEFKPTLDVSEGLARDASGGLAATCEDTKPTGDEPPRRVAFVIGIGAYRTVPPLRNPSRDASGMSEVLERLGFTVHCKMDATKAEFERGLRDFLRDLKGAEAGLFFYAGHGLQLNGANYLLPADSEIAEESDVRLASISLDDVLGDMASLCSTSVVFLDACRNNPWARALAMSGGTRTVAVRQGLAEARVRRGSYIAYATEPGQVALDGEGGNSPFTSALLRHVEAPGQTIDGLMFAVRNDVLTATGGAQVPWSHSSLLAPFSFRGNAAQPAGDHPWTVLQETRDPRRLRRFVEEFPNDRFVGEAWNRLSVLEEEAWQKRKSTPYLEELDDFICQFPDGYFNSAAQTLRIARRKYILAYALAVSALTAVLSSVGGDLIVLNAFSFAYPIYEPQGGLALFYLWNSGIFLYGVAIFFVVRQVLKIHFAYIVLMTVLVHFGWISAHLTVQLAAHMFELGPDLITQLDGSGESIRTYFAIITMYGVASLIGAGISMTAVWVSVKGRRNFDGRLRVVSAVAVSSVLWAATVDQTDGPRTDIVSGLPLQILPWWMLFLAWQITFAVGVALLLIYNGNAARKLV